MLNTIERAKRDAGLAIRLINDQTAHYGSTRVIAPTFSGTNENFNGYFPSLPINGGNLFTIGGSGDSIIEGVLYGAKVIHSVDRNASSDHFTALKLAALKELSNKDFKIFFDFSEYEGLASDTYGQVRCYLDEYHSTFWDLLYDGVIGDYDPGNIIAQSDFFVTGQKRFNPEYRSRFVAYYDKENYAKVKDLISDVQISHSVLDIRDVSDAYLDNFYNAIILSNVYHDIIGEAQVICNSEQAFFDFFEQVVDKLIPKLVMAGSMMFAYVHMPVGDEIVERVKRHIKSQFLQMLKFDCTIRGQLDSAALLYQKSGKSR